MSRCSLVHPSTSKLGPADQAKGNYEYTPPLVLAYLRGEQLSEADLIGVSEFYADKGLPMPTLESGPALAGVKPERSIDVPPAFAAPSNRKVVRKVVSEEAPPRKPLEEIVSVAISCYTPLQKEALFNQLAAELGYSVE